MRLINFLMLVVTMALTGCVTEQEPDAWSLPIGAAMPAFDVELIDGTHVSSAELTGRKSVIVFFNTECGDCRRELPQIEAVSHEFPEVEFLCIARAEGADAIARFWADEGLTLAVSPQPDRAVYSLFAEAWIPRIFVFAPSGRLMASLKSADGLTAAL